MPHSVFEMERILLPLQFRQKHHILGANCYPILELVILTNTNREVEMPEKPDNPQGGRPENPGSQGNPRRPDDVPPGPPGGVPPGPPDEVPPGPKDPPVPPQRRVGSH